jgi:hypothetical protein
MAWWIWLLRGLAVLLAFGGGWGFGRAIPGWQIDRANEDTSRLRGRYYGGGSAGGGGCGYLLMLFFQGAWGAGAMLIGALVLIPFGWPGLEALDRLNRNEREIVMLFQSPFWLLAIAGLAGYVVSRLTDKGPVGPLE